MMRGGYVPFIPFNTTEMTSLKPKIFYTREHGDEQRLMNCWNLLEVMGDTHGAKSCFFNRYENEVIGLPHQGKLAVKEINYHFPHFPLRLMH